MSSISLKNTSGNAINLQSSTSLASDVTLTLPTDAGSAGQVLSTNGSGLLSFVNAITEVDLWHLTANKTSDGDLTDLSRNSASGNTQIGTGMSVSSGVFTFPSTGKWLIIAKIQFVIDDSDSCTVDIFVTLDNSTFNRVARAGDGNNGTGLRLGGDTAFYFLDVTDTSQVKVKFTAASLTADSRIDGQSDYLKTSFMFIRLGDT